MGLRTGLEPRDRTLFLTPLGFRLLSCGLLGFRFLGFAVAAAGEVAAGGVAGGLPDAAPCATPRLRGDGADEMLANRKPAKALTRTVVRVLLLPLSFVLICTFGSSLPLVWPLKNLVLINYAREQMRRQFRSLLTERYGWADEAELVGQPSKRARASQLPPVLRR